jgi:site-specific DNA-methyltransferase (adenine-specific)
MNDLVQCTALDGLADVSSESIPLVVTSPPWGKTRTYGNHIFDFEAVADELWRVIKPGGIVCWEYKDQIEDGSLTCEHCRQLLYFRRLGFRVHEDLTIVIHNYKPLEKRHYRLVSHVYVLAKGKPGVVNRLKIVRNGNPGTTNRMNFRNPDGTIKRNSAHVTQEIGYRSDVWHFDEDDGLLEYHVGWGKSCEDKETFKSRHGAIMPWQLAHDLIRTYSTPGSMVLDVCGGTGTTGVAALMTGRQYLLFEPWDDAIVHAQRRLANMIGKAIVPTWVTTPKELADNCQV